MSVSFKEKKIKNTGSFISKLEKQIEWIIQVNGKTFYSIFLSYNELSNRKKVKVNENLLLDASIDRSKFNHFFQIENIDMAIKFNSITKKFNLFAYGKNVEIFPVIQHPQFEQAQAFIMNQQMLLNQDLQRQQYSQQQLRNQNQSIIQNQLIQPPVLGIPVGKDGVQAINQLNSSPPPPQMQLQIPKQLSQKQSEEKTKERISKYLESQLISSSQVLQAFKEVMEHCRNNQDVIESKELQDFKVAVGHNYQVLVSYTEYELEEKLMEKVLRILDETHIAIERYRRICSLEEIISDKQKPNVNQRAELMIKNDNQYQQQQNNKAEKKLDLVQQAPESEDIQLIQLDNNSDEDYDDYGFADLNENNQEMKSKKIEQQPFMESAMKNKGEINNQGGFIQQLNNSNQIETMNDQKLILKSMKKEQSFASSDSQQFIQNGNSNNKLNREILFQDKDAVDSANLEEENNKKSVSLSMLENKMNKLKALKDSQWAQKARQVGWKEEFPDVANKGPRKAYPNPKNIVKSPVLPQQNDIKDDKNNKKKSELKSQLLDDQLCIICFQNESIFALVPCGHKKYCESCAEEMVKKQVCAFCMKPATQKMRIFS